MAKIPVLANKEIERIQTFPHGILCKSLLVQSREPDADRPPVCLELLHLGQLHDGPAHVPQTLGCQVGAGNVLDKGR